MTNKATTGTRGQERKYPHRFVAPYVQEGEFHLTYLAEEPMIYCRSLPALPRGTARRAVNTDLPAELGDWLADWCAANDVSQRLLFRALVSALKNDVEGTDKHPHVPDEDED